MVASTGIYGDIAQRIGGSAVEVTVLIEDPQIDPHEFQATARDVLALSRADVVVMNGGGYDGFMDQLLVAADNPSAPVIDMADLLGIGPEDNEHVFYAPENIRRLATELVDVLDTLAPRRAPAFDRAAESLDEDLDDLATRVEHLRGAHRGTPVAATDPAAEAFAAVVALDNRTPEEFMIAIEDETGVAARNVRTVLDLVGHGTVELVVTEAGVVDPQVHEVLAAARARDTPVVTVTEMLPPDEHYVSWMRGNLDRLEAALETRP